MEMTGKRKGGVQRLPRHLAATPPLHMHVLQDLSNWHTDIVPIWSTFLHLTNSMLTFPGLLNIAFFPTPRRKKGHTPLFESSTQTYSDQNDLFFCSSHAKQVESHFFGKKSESLRYSRINLIYAKEQGLGFRTDTVWPVEEAWISCWNSGHLTVTWRG